MCPVGFLEVDVGSTRPINRGQFGVDGDEDGQMITGQSGHWTVRLCSFGGQVAQLPILVFYGALTC